MAQDDVRFGYPGETARQYSMAPHLPEGRSEDHKGDCRPGGEETVGDVLGCQRRSDHAANDDRRDRQKDYAD